MPGTRAIQIEESTPDIYASLDAASDRLRLCLFRRQTYGSVALLMKAHASRLIVCAIAAYP